jgi:DNA polymerase III alpha subunit
MAFVKLEDYTHSYEAVIFGSVFAKCEMFLKNDEIVFMQGTLNSIPDENVIKIVTEAVYDVNRVPELFTESVLLKLKREKMDSELLQKLKLAIKSSPGNNPLYLKMSSNGDDGLLMRAGKHGIAMTLPTLRQLCLLIGTENIQIKINEAG